MNVQCIHFVTSNLAVLTQGTSIRHGLSPDSFEPRTQPHWRELIGMKTSDVPHLVSITHFPVPHFSSWFQMFSIIHVTSIWLYLTCGMLLRCSLFWLSAT